MPRPERPIEAGPLAQFAAGLRELRQATGGMTYRDMAKEANYSATVLSEAAGGRRLPTLDVTVAYVRACGGDVEEWTDRWHELAGRERAKPADMPARNPQRSRRAVLITIAVTAIVAAVLVVVLVPEQAEVRVIMPEDVVHSAPPGPEATVTEATPPNELPCSTRDRAQACVDLERHLVWVKDLPPSDSHHAAIYWTTTDGALQGQCHNFKKSDGPWVTCPYVDPAEPATLGFRSAVVEEELVLEWGPYITMPVS